MKIPVLQVPAGKVAVVAGLALFAMLPLAPAVAQSPPKTVELTFASIYPATHSESGENASPGKWLKAVEEASNGRIKFKRHWGSDLVPPLQLLKAAGAGTVDIILTYPSFYAGEVAIGDLDVLPTAFKDGADLFDAWFNTPVGSIVSGVYEKAANVKALFPTLAGPNVLQISKKMPKIKTVDQLKGRIVRTSAGPDRDIMRELGASTVQLVTTDVYLALERGTVDVSMMTNATLQAYALWEVVHQVTPAVTPVVWSMVYMNLDKWKQLDPDLQKLLIDTERKMEKQFIADVAANTDRIVETAKTKYGIEYYTWPPEEEKKLIKASAVAWDAYVSRNTKQGFGAEAQRLKDILTKRFESK